MDLIIHAPGGQERHRHFARSSAILVGRDPSSDVVLLHRDVSRQHCRLEQGPQGWQMVDDSSNGSYVGDVFVRGGSMAIPSGATLRIGPFVIGLIGDEHSGRAPSAPPCARIDLDDPALRRRLHRRLIEDLNLAGASASSMADERLRPRVQALFERLVQEACAGHDGAALDALVGELVDEALGLGPLEPLLADPSVSEIMVVDPSTIYVERDGVIERSARGFTDDDAARAAIERIVAPLGRRIDESMPYVDARLRDGSRVNAIISPLALRGACITIRKFPTERLGLAELIAGASLDQAMARLLTRSVAARKNIVIAGGTGSGKTTLLNVLSQSIGAHERVITIEDAAELQLRQEHVVSLEARPPNLEGRGAVTIRDLLRNALRMRPDRIIVGECRGGEALDVLQAMNTGHDGSMTTVHANSPTEALGRLETLALMAGLDLPGRAIREQVATSIDLIVQQTRLSDGSRKITSITEVLGIDEEGHIDHRELFRFHRTGTAAGGTAEGRFLMTGQLPSYLGELVTLGLARPGELV